VASRIAKVFMSLAFGLFGLLVALDNLLDYDTNFAFVQHVFSMDTTFPNGRLHERAVLDPVWWHGGYALIILGEAVTGLLFLIGAARMLQALRAPAARFDSEKSWSILGATAGFGVWFVGFMLVGGEWFQMWQSPSWNGQTAAFRFYMPLMAGLIFIALPEREIA
jgi:predicted small integral membrane protein